MVTLVGRDVLRSLRRGAADARQRSAQAEARLQSKRNRMASLASERMATLQELAATRLPELNQDTAAAAMPEFAAELQSVERARQLREDELHVTWAQLQDEAGASAVRLAELTEQLDTVVKQRDELSEQVAAKLQARPDYQPLADQAQQAEVRLARDLDRQQQIAEEAREKLPPYEQCRLFQYLWRRNYGTPDYGSRGFVARMDRRLARFLGYPEAVISYRFLKTTPELVRLEVERRTAEAEELRERVERVEEAVEVEVGLPVVRAHGEQLGRERAELLAQIETLQERIAATQRALREEVGGRGAFHRQALQKLTGFLARAEAVTLERRALETPEPTDDRLVIELRQHAQELADTADQVTPLEHEAVRRDAIADELDGLVGNYLRREFDSGRSRFKGFDFDGQLLGAVDGRTQVDDLWQSLRSRHWFLPPPLVRHRDRTDNVLSGIGLAVRVLGSIAGAAVRSSGSSRSSGGFGGFGSGGGFGGGGGFSSGRGFGGGGGGGGFTSGSGF